VGLCGWLWSIRLQVLLPSFIPSFSFLDFFLFFSLFSQNGAISFVSEFPSGEISGNGRKSLGDGPVGVHGGVVAHGWTGALGCVHHAAG